MKRRRDLYAGRDMAEWSTEQLRRLADLQPGEPLGFARWRADAAEVFGFSTTSLLPLQAAARSLLEERK